jgi:hypothetical protein
MPRPGFGNTEAQTVLCPLFRAITPNEIRCESHVPESNGVAIQYRSTAAVEKQRRIYCEENWERCEHYLAWKHMRWED